LYYRDHYSAQENKHNTQPQRCLSSESRPVWGPLPAALTMHCVELLVVIGVQIDNKGWTALYQVKNDYFFANNLRVPAGFQRPWDALGTGGTCNCSASQLQNNS
jgi:hypothetical protein